MTLMIRGGESRWRRRKDSSGQHAPGPKPQLLPQEMVQNANASSSTGAMGYGQYLQPPPYSSPPIPYGSPGYDAHSPPQHLHSNHSTYFDAGNSTTNLPDSPPPDANDDMLRSHMKRAKQMTAKSYNNLRDQLTSQAERSVNQLTSKTSQYYDQSTNMVNQSTYHVTNKSTQMLNQGAALCDRINSKFDAVITSIDEELFSGREQDLFVDDTLESSSPDLPPRLENNTRSQLSASTSRPTKKIKKSNHFSKVWLYANSRLPPHLPPFKIYMATWPLLCLAARYSERVYTPPGRSHPEISTHIPSDWRSGAKAMVIKSIPCDDMQTIVFSIRGSATFMDWAVNYKSDPVSPLDFIDDPGNLCHAGFLHVARQMITPVATRLRQLLEQAPDRSHSSLLITGHSAGGAVAALLYAHMHSETCHSDLTHLTGFFKRVHCVTFGAPPVSLLPLSRPSGKRFAKSMFYAFVNEGDPVPRADKEVVKSLIRLFASPAPTPTPTGMGKSLAKLGVGGGKLGLAASSSSSSSLSMMMARPVWDLPPTTLSAAGRVIVLRKKKVKKGSGKGKGSGGRGIEAVTVSDELLRTVVYGDPLMHMMAVYKKRVEQLAVGAVTVTGF
jgi:hypothetical protein